MRAQRSTGTTRRGGSFTATGTGCDRYVTFVFSNLFAQNWPRAGGRATEGGPACATHGRRTEDRRVVRDTRLTCYTQAPEVQTMYSLNLPVSTLRTKIRQEFERHRYVNQMRTVDVLLFNSHQEYQVRCLNTHLSARSRCAGSRRAFGCGPATHHTVRSTCGRTSAKYEQETLNYWKQLNHVLKYFRAEEEPNARLPNNFINGFLEVCVLAQLDRHANADL
jgi:NADH dehydrogenase (ubiquinone) 1 alpha subcomplex subunit 6